METRVFQHKDILKIFPDLSSRGLVSWSEKGLLSPDYEDAKGRGSIRRFSFDNVMQAGVIRELFLFGFGFRDIRTFVADRWMNDMKRFRYSCALTIQRRSLREADDPGDTSPRFNARVLRLKAFEFLGARAILQEPGLPSVGVINVERIHQKVTKCPIPGRTKTRPIT